VNEILKQRLVGALILIALAVVFWPIIFVEPDESPIPGDMTIPERPHIDISQIPQPDPAQARSSPALEARSEAAGEQAVAAAEPSAPVAAQQKPVVKQRAPRDEAPERPALDAQGLPIAWILQVASVSSPDKAEQIRQRLTGMGYKAYVKTVRHDGKKLLRVYIGPKFERSRLDAIKSEVDKAFSVESLVTRYVP
jgi:DedD protein